MHKLIVSSVVTAGLLAAPAFAQTTPGTAPAGTAKTTADCEGNFKTADRDGNGSLNATEIAAATSVVPTSLKGRQMITKSDFLSACANTVGNQKK
ncbi:MAG TPA: hypothetical protein PK970_01975 [Hyphomicrobiaceae bacterium]|nr:hypothetical protein [Hyphomicrobiaceae bacterium]